MADPPILVILLCDVNLSVLDTVWCHVARLIEIATTAHFTKSVECGYVRDVNYFFKSIFNRHTSLLNVFECAHVHM
jgi:hypothetical protein